MRKNNPSRTICETFMDMSAEIGNVAKRSSTILFLQMTVDCAFLQQPKVEWLIFLHQWTWAWARTNSPPKPRAHHEPENTGSNRFRARPPGRPRRGQSGSDVQHLVLIQDPAQPSRCVRPQVRKKLSSLECFNGSQLFLFCNFKSGGIWTCYIETCVHCYKTFLWERRRENVKIFRNAWISCHNLYFWWVNLY